MGEQGGEKGQNEGKRKGEQKRKGKKKGKDGGKVKTYVLLYQMHRYPTFLITYNGPIVVVET